MRDDPSAITQGDPEVDALFHALSDATRRDILRRCLDQEPSVSRLAAAYPVSITAIQKHVKVLEDAGLVTRRKQGREQLVSTRFDGLAQARQALDRLEGAWRARIQQMDDILAGESGDALTPQGEPHGRHGY
ncbi:MAG: metalloregulator ArsR/SmtB family transcription factor [Thermomicrobiales bacterium]